MNITINLSGMGFGTGCMWLAAGFLFGCYLLAYAIYENRK